MTVNVKKTNVNVIPTMRYQDAVVAATPAAIPKNTCGASGRTIRGPTLEHHPNPDDS